MTDFTITLLVGATPQQAFDAIVNPRAWWGQDIEGDTDRPGAEWTYRYKDMHFSRQRNVEMIPASKVTWHVVDASMSFIEDKAEWKDTRIVFELEPQGDMTAIRFTHVGLQPTVECFDICSDTWTGLITGSLKKLIETGSGDPDSVEKAAA
jgi:uncharacterized protein YndB with AHSA1/START domain